MSKMEYMSVVDWAGVIRDSAKWRPYVELVTFGFLKREEFEH
jgi:hypothetical protein